MKTALTALLLSASCPQGIDPTGATLRWQDDQATATVVGGSPDARVYRLDTTHTLRPGGAPPNGRLEVREDPTQPVARTGSVLFDALFALAVQEAKDASVDEISDGSFGASPCPCFETGREWTYVWTRDIAYATALGLAWLDPARAMNSLLFKVSPRRSGDRAEIVQDTGSGGSWPVSTDRVVWALGADEVLKSLQEPARTRFFDVAYPALAQTLETDRKLAFDRETSLYRGETSFLDWREQTYPSWTREDTLPIASSYALSTNVLHHAALRIAARWARLRGDAPRAATFGEHADQLERRIDTLFWHADGHYGSVRHGRFDESLSPHRDLLAEALAVTSGVAPAERAWASLETYPQSCAGAPVIWPQLPSVPVYHNRAIWPFVSTLWLYAAKERGHAATLLPTVTSLMRGAALNASNMENFEFVSHANWYAPGGGPVINSRRQIWSVGGYLGMVADVLFGRVATDEGLRFSPFVTPALRAALFPSSERLRLERLPFLGRRIDVELAFPAEDGAKDGAYVVRRLVMNGVEHDPRKTFRASDLDPRNTLVIELDAPSADGGRATILPLTRGGPDDPDALTTAPAEPELLGATWRENGAELSLRAGGDTFLRVYRDGVLLATDVPSDTRAWLDRSAPRDRTPCYAVSAVSRRTGFESHRSRGHCAWAEGAVDVVSTSDASRLLSGYRPRFDGSYRFQIHYRNEGPINTGITAAVKELVVTDAATGAVVATDVLVMPHTGAPAQWRDSTATGLVALRKDRTYDVQLRDAQNMSYFSHFARYTGAGGRTGARNAFELRSVKILSAARGL